MSMPSKEEHIKELMKWEKDEMRARWKSLDCSRAIDNMANISEIESFFKRNADRFAYFDKIPESNIELARNKVGCAYMNYEDEQKICPFCKLSFTSFGQFASMDLTSAPICFAVDVSVYRWKRRAVTFLMPILCEFDSDIEESYYIRERIDNPTGITFLDVYRRMQQVLNTSLSDPKLNLCIRQLRLYSGPTPDSPLYIRTDDEDKSPCSPVMFLDEDGEKIERLVDIRSYAAATPTSLYAFNVPNEHFLLVKYES